MELASINNDNEPSTSLHTAILNLRRKLSIISDSGEGPGWACDKNEWSLVSGDGKMINLMYIKHKKKSMRHFGLEVRASLDINHLLDEALVLLDVQKNSVEELISTILHDNNFNSNKDDDFHPNEVKNILFTDDTAQMFSRIYQAIKTNGSTCVYDHSWICSICNVPSLKKRKVAIVRLKQPVNFGVTCQEVRFFILVLCPSKDKSTKTASETGRTFGTIFSDINVRQKLLYAQSVNEFKAIILNQSDIIAADQAKPLWQPPCVENPLLTFQETKFGAGIKADFFRRIPYYISDYVDGIKDCRSIQKTISTSVFLYFACLLPTIAFGTLNDNNTHGIIDTKSGIVAQAIGQLIFSIFSGQHLCILMTTAPLCLFVKITYDLSKHFEILGQFSEFYCCVGLWSSFFLILYAFFDASKIMKWCTRSTEEIFAMFISIAYVVYAFTDVVGNFHTFYYAKSCTPNKSLHLVNQSNITSDVVLFSPRQLCQREISLMFLLMMLGTFFLGYVLYSFKNTPFLHATRREVLSDYALPIAVVVFSLIRTFVFYQIPSQNFRFDVDDGNLFALPHLHNLPVSLILLSSILGFSLSVLIFMDQNIAAAIVNNPSNNLKKGRAYNWDLMMTGIINAILSLFAFPWLHVALPHTPMHVRSLADIEERVEQEFVYEIIARVRETRLTGLISHLLIGVSVIFLLPFPLTYIPNAVLDGLFLFLGFTALSGNQLFQRILLLFTEQSSYPPSHYIRRVPQRKMHLFTGIQLIQLAILCVIGFAPIPYIKVLFPIILLLLLLIRQKIIPLIFEHKYLVALD